MKKTRVFALAAVLLSGIVLLTSCAQRGEPFKPTVPSGIDSTKVDGNEFGRWTRAKSPYFVVDDVTVPVNRTLIIDPGVSVVFIYPGLSLKIEGTLIAEGTSDSLITFRATLGSGISTFPGDWGSLVFRGSRDNRLDWVRILYATNGIVATDSEIRLRNSIVKDTQFDALQLTRTSLDLEECTIASNGGNGLTLVECENPPYPVRIIHCNIGFNRLTGIRGVNSTVYAERSDIKNNGFRATGDPNTDILAGGLHFEGAPGLNLPLLRQCNVEVNFPCEVRNLMSDGLAVVADSLFWGITTTDNMDALSNTQNPDQPRRDNCFFNVPVICAPTGSVTFCFWRDDPWPNFPSSKAETWNRGLRTR